MTPYNDQIHQNALPSQDDITREVLPNGIIILTRPNFNSPTLTIKGYVHSGSYQDPEEKLGLGYLTAYGLMTGTKNHDFQGLYNAVESVGASLSFNSGTLTTSFNAHCLNEDMSLLLTLIAECLRSPTFPEKEFLRQRTQMLTALAIRAQDTASMAALLFDQILYAGHPYEKPEEGFIETVQAIERQDLISFYQRTYGPKNMVIAIVGAVEPQNAIDAIKHTLGDWTNDQQEEVPVVPPMNQAQKTTQKSVHIPGKSQADIVMGCLAPERLSPDYQALRIANNILGEFGMMGRLGHKVREESGLAYYAYSSLSVSIGPGAWEMIAGINPKNIDKTIELMTDEVRKIITAPVTKEELSDTKSYYLGSMPLMLESNSGVAVSLLNIEHFQLGLDYFLSYKDQVQAVTALDVLKASQKYLDPDCLAIAIAGPGEI